jgi:hypothetical protein
MREEDILMNESTGLHIAGFLEISAWPPKAVVSAIKLTLCSLKGPGQQL